MAYVVIVIDTEESIPQLNGRVINAAGNAREGTQKLEKLIQDVLSRNIPGSVEVTTRSTDPSVATAGDSSAQVIYNIG